MQAAALTRASVCQGKIFKSYLTHNIIAIDFVEPLISCEMRMKLHHGHYRSHCAAMPSHGIHRFHRWTHTAKHGNGNSSVPPNIFTSYITSLSLLLKTENNGRPLPAKNRSPDMEILLLRCSTICTAYRCQKIPQYKSMILNTARMFNNVGLIYTPMIFPRGWKPIYIYIQLQNQYPPWLSFPRHDEVCGKWARETPQWSWS